MIIQPSPAPAMRRLCAVLALAFALPGQAAGPALKPSGAWTAQANGRAATPPMGWNSWNAYRTEVTEDKIMGAAEQLVALGLADKGYRYVNIDDGWTLQRRQSDGKLLVRTSIYPSAAVGGAEHSSFKGWTDRLHKMGLKAGIYTDIGRNMCSQAWDLHSPNLPTGSQRERETGIDGNVERDIKLFFVDWGFDYIKVDGCGLADFAPDSKTVRENGYRGMVPEIDRSSISRSQPAKVRARFEQVAAALRKYKPDNDYVFSVCLWGAADVNSWGGKVGNAVRTSGDIVKTWGRMLYNFDSAVRRPLYAQPGSWNDPDILYVGHGDFDERHLTEARSHFALWSMVNAPLLMSYDLKQAPAALLDIWGNRDLIGMNQDAGGHQASLVFDSDDVQILSKTLADPGRKGVLLFNRSSGMQKITLTAEHLRFGDGEIVLRDLWTGATHRFSKEISFELAPRESLAFEARGARALADGWYLSEIPGRVNVAADGITHPQPDPLQHRMLDPWGEGSRSGGAYPELTGWGGAQPDQSPYGSQLRVGGRKFRTGIGILENSRLEVKNDGEFKRFDGLVGVDDWNTRSGKVRFEVYGDGKLLAQSGWLARGSAAVPLQAKLDGVKVVELIARGDKARDTPLAVTWAEARLSGR